MSKPLASDYFKLIIALTQLLRTLWNICLLRKGPEDLPINHTLVGITLGIGIVGVYFFERLLLDMVSLMPLTGAVEERGTALNFIQLLVSMLISFTLFAAVLYLILLTFKREARTYKTFFALQGTNLIISWIAIVAIATTLIIVSLNVQMVSLIFGSLLLLFGLALGIWVILVNSHIFRRALDSGLGKGFLIMIVHTLLIGILNYFLRDLLGSDSFIQI